MIKPDRLYIGIYTYSSLIQSSNLSSLLDAFESQDGLKPTHWSSDDPEEKRFSGYQPYNRDSYSEKVSSLQEHSGIPSLYRRQVPQYAALLRNTRVKFKSISVTFDKKIRAVDVPEIYAWACSLSKSIDAELVFVDPGWDDISYDYAYTARTKAEDFYSYGLKTISARTYFGQYLVALIGRDRLHNCGGYVQDMESGGVLLDLVENPWEVDAQTLTAAQKRIKENLEPSGVFGDYTKRPFPKPGANWSGANWSPIPQPVKS